MNDEELDPERGKGNRTKKKQLLRGAQAQRKSGLDKSGCQKRRRNRRKKKTSATARSSGRPGKKGGPRRPPRRDLRKNARPKKNIGNWGKAAIWIRRKKQKEDLPYGGGTATAPTEYVGGRTDKGRGKKRSLRTPGVSGQRDLQDDLLLQKKELKRKKGGGEPGSEKASKKSCVAWRGGGSASKKSGEKRSAPNKTRVCESRGGGGDDWCAGGTA